MYVFSLTDLKVFLDILGGGEGKVEWTTLSISKAVV